MSENYYMWGYQEPDQNLLDEVGELKEKIEDLELEISRLEDELSNAIPIDWLEQWDKDNGSNWNLGYTISYIIKDWRKSNE